MARVEFGSGSREGIAGIELNQHSVFQRFACFR
jgi:hypothetical protein